MKEKVKITVKQKIKKADIGETWDLKLKKNIDILDSIDKNGIYAIGFKAELDQNVSKENATNMLKNKNLDAVCLNEINQSNQFGGETNKIELITRENNTEFPLLNKFELSLLLLDNLKGEFYE